MSFIQTKKWPLTCLHSSSPSSTWSQYWANNLTVDVMERPLTIISVATQESSMSHALAPQMTTTFKCLVRSISCSKNLFSLWMPLSGSLLASMTSKDRLSLKKCTRLSSH
eukprot:scaffold1912_cov135-Cylindrotheca_fusiformis.AAC.12